MSEFFCLESQVPRRVACCTACAPSQFRTASGTELTEQPMTADDVTLTEGLVADLRATVARLADRLAAVRAERDALRVRVATLMRQIGVSGDVVRAELEDTR